MRRLVGVLAATALVVLFGLTALRFVDTSRSWLIMAAAFSSYAVLGFVVVLVVSLLLLRGAGRRRGAIGLCVVSVVGLGAHVYWLSPLYVGGGGRTDLVVMSANLEFGHGDPTSVVHAVQARHVDVLVVQEVTPSEATAL